MASSPCCALPNCELKPLEAMEGLNPSVPTAEVLQAAWEPARVYFYDEVRSLHCSRPFQWKVSQVHTGLLTGSQTVPPAPFPLLTYTHRFPWAHPAVLHFRRLLMAHQAAAIAPGRHPQPAWCIQCQCAALRGPNHHLSISSLLHDVLSGLCFITARRCCFFPSPG